ncbi:MAG: asparagine synthase-related protein [Actinomycetota bacterium]|nr:asparagine synthase-related protein [Actinomycetota bacterium]MDQ3648512.1 asparagine synthase-related protein [Actinomycetota bacterium]
MTGALAGALRLRGGPAPGDRLQSIVEGLRLPEGARLQTRESGPCALGWAGDGGEHEGLVAAADGRPVGAGAQGAGALASAVREDGPEAPGRLAGQFAGAVWDPQAQRLVLVRDAGPTRSLFWAREDDLLLWASELRALRAGLRRPARLDEAALGAHVGCISLADRARTFWHELRRVPAEHVLVAEAPAAQAELRRASDVLSSPVRRDEPVERLDRALAEAVADSALPADRLAIALSGGLDSTTVGWHGARARGEAGVSLLDAYTLDYERFPDADEREYVEAALAAIPCRHHWLSGDRAYPLGDWPHTFAGEDEPPPTFGSVGALGLLRAAARSGACGALTGHGSDNVLIASPTQRLELLARGGFVSDALAFRRRHGRLPPLALGHAARITVLRHAPWVQRLRRHPPQLGLLRRDFVARSGLLDDMCLEGRVYGSDTSRRRTVRDSGSHRHQRRSEHLDSLGRQAGVELLHPFLDRRVMEVAASLPGEAVFGGGETKIALRRAMSGRLPDKVIDKRLPTGRGGPYAFALGPEGRGNVVSALFADPVLGRLGVADPTVLRSAHDRFVQGDHSGLMRLISAVGCEIWLRRELGEPLPEG